MGTAEDKDADNQKMFWLIFCAEVVRTSLTVLGCLVLKVLGLVWGSVGCLGVFFGALGGVLGVLLETVGRFWIILGRDRLQAPRPSMMVA